MHFHIIKSFIKKNTKKLKQLNLLLGTEMFTFCIYDYQYSLSDNFSLFSNSKIMQLNKANFSIRKYWYSNFLTSHSHVYTFVNICYKRRKEKFRNMLISGEMDYWNIIWVILEIILCLIRHLLFINLTLMKYLFEF